MDPRVRRNVVILLLVSLAAAIVLSSGLADLELEAGDPFPGASGSADPVVPGAAARRLPPEESLPAFRGVLALILLVLGAVLVRRFLSLVNVKRMVGVLAAVIIVLLLLIFLPRVPVGEAITLPPESAAPPVPAEEVATSPLGAPPTSVMWVAGIVVLAAVAAALLIALRPQAGPVDVTEQIRADVEGAVKAIEAGENATHVILRCYMQMSRHIEQARGVSRHRGMTVREFETVLREMGLPTEPSAQLRRLFEAYRYGDRDMTPAEEGMAVASLNEIVAFLNQGTA